MGVRIGKKRAQTYIPKVSYILKKNRVEFCDLCEFLGNMILLAYTIYTYLPLSEQSKVIPDMNVYANGVA